MLLVRAADELLEMILAITLPGTTAATPAEVGVTLMLHGASLVLALPGRLGWELRGVVQGGLHILDHIAALDHATLARRPTLGKTDALVVAWRGLTMR